MTVHGTHAGVHAHPHTRRRTTVCIRCGARRQANGTRPAPLCTSCAQVVRDLGEEEVWR